MSKPDNDRPLHKFVIVKMKSGPLYIAPVGTPPEDFRRTFFANERRFEKLAKKGIVQCSWRDGDDFMTVAILKWSMDVPIPEVDADTVRKED